MRWCSRVWEASVVVLFLSLTLLPSLVTAFGLSSPLLSSSVKKRPLLSNRATVELQAQRKSSESREAALLELEEETPAGVVGAEFFGGSKQKEELYDPIAEAEADRILFQDVDSTTSITTTTTRDDVGKNQFEYSRLDDPIAFDLVTKPFARALQQQINAILYEEDSAISTTSATPSATTTTTVQYSPNLSWTSPLRQGNSPTPFHELEKALSFYKRIDVAIVSARSISPTVYQVRWEVAVAWPIFWEARVLVTGSSEITWNHDPNNNNIVTIVKQVDTLDQPDLLGSIASQVIPRFWDTYHIGMTPSAECMPHLTVANQNPLSLLRSYNLYEIPPRLVYHPSVIDTGSSREDANAQTIPNHSFTTVIKTMGPKRQRYVPTSPVQVQLTKPENRLVWSIPVSIELQTNPILPLPRHDPETLPEAMPEAVYEYQLKRRVATLSYGGSPQDIDVVDLRKRLYEQVVKDGHTPKLDESGRPQFFFLQNDVKACYTDGGLGMAVYDWRPKFAKANEVGIELEILEGTQGLAKM